jgi:outer membrane protein insertion porin family
MKNYYVGGIGSVRGYSPGSLGPIFRNSLTGLDQATGASSKLVGSVEYAFPVPGSGTDKTLRFFGFVDAGSAFNQISDLGEYMRYSYGMGIAWISPLGPLKFSYGVPINTKSTDKVQNLQFQLGTLF